MERATAAARVKAIIAILKRTHPDAQLALNFSSPVELLVALILAAQCTDKKVNEVTATLFRRYPTARAFAEAAPEDLEAAIRPTGFYRQKTKSLRACCRQLVDRFDGTVPRELEALLTLPGVGRKTANIVLGNAFGVPAIGVDTHVARLAQRLGLSAETDADRIEADLVRLVPAPERIRFCHLLQFHGRRVCAARKPNCPDCPIAALCPYPDKTPPVTKAPATRSRWIGRRPGAQ